MELNPPTAEQYGLTQERAAYFKKNTETTKLTVAIAVIINIIALLIFDASILRIKPFLLFLFLAVYPGYFIGGVIDAKRTAKITNFGDYKNYLEYKNALTNYYDLLKKMRRDDAKKRREFEAHNRKKEEWWRGIDGHRFELEVTKLLMSKNYDVKHTGSTWGDEGVDLILRQDNKTIIIQCKAFKDYVSAGYVRELYGTLMHQKADEAWLVVTSGFYSGAKQFANDKPIRLFTIKDLIKMPPNT